MPQAENGKEKDDALRRFIDKLEDWPEDDPPSPADLRAIKREIRLSDADRDKLELLAENHVRRARASLDAGAYDQAAAELARAAQLRPLDAKPRVELAGIYLQRSLERGYGRHDRIRAVKLARKALDLSPQDPEAKRFLREYRRMNADFRNIRIRRFVGPAVLALLFIAAVGWWQRDWVMGVIRPMSAEVPDSPTAVPGAIPSVREVVVDSSGLAGGDVTTEIISASVGRRNDGSFLDIRAKFHNDARPLGKMELLIRGRDMSGRQVFALPWTARGEGAPVLLPGDSEAVALYRWLSDSEENVRSLELVPMAIESPTFPGYPETTDVEVVWNGARPDGSSLSAVARNIRTIEAYDKQVMFMDLALENGGTREIASLSFDISVSGQDSSAAYMAIESELPGISRGETRVWPVVMPLPLDADLAGRPLELRITEAR